MSDKITSEQALLIAQKHSSSFWDTVKDVLYRDVPRAPKGNYCPTCNGPLIKISGVILCIDPKCRQAIKQEATK